MLFLATLLLRRSTQRPIINSLFNICHCTRKKGGWQPHGAIPTGILRWPMQSRALLPTGRKLGQLAHNVPAAQKRNRSANEYSHPPVECEFWQTSTRIQLSGTFSDKRVILAGLKLKKALQTGAFHSSAVFSAPKLDSSTRFRFPEQINWKRVLVSNQTGDRVACLRDLRKAGRISGSVNGGSGGIGTLLRSAKTAEPPPYRISTQITSPTAGASMPGPSGSM